MRITKLQLAGLLAGAILLGGVASVTAQPGEVPETPDVAPAGVVVEGAEDRPKHRVHHRGGLYGPVGHAMRVTAELPPNDDGEVRTLRIDRGVVTEVGDAGFSVEEADETVVEIDVADDTRIRRDGEEASLSDLQSGDHVVAVRTKLGDGEFTTRGVRAISEERYEEMEERREECRENPERCRAERRARFGDAVGDPRRR